jgi:hypothetical protein
MKDVVKQGVKDIFDTLKVKGVQGAAEAAQALFTGGGYVPYGRGQGAANDHDHEQPAQENAGHEQEQQRDRGRGM